jgi:hypothetical protein
VGETAYGGGRLGPGRVTGADDFVVAGDFNVLIEVRQAGGEAAGDGGFDKGVMGALKD